MKKRLAFFLIPLLLLAAAPVAQGYTQISRQGSLARWPSSAQIRYVFNSNLAPSNPAELVAGALRSAFNQWNAAMAANGIAVRFVDGGTTTLNRQQCDGVNLVTFTQPDPPLPAEALAAAFTFTVSSPGTITGCGAPFDAQFAGQIIDFDVLFNTTRQFSTVGLQGTFDIEPVAIHEIGHGLGLDHSGVNSAIMAPAGESSGGFALRRLQADDIAGINFAYGTNGLGGAISGRVTTITTAPVLGAQVVATDANTGVTTAAALSGPDGSYRIVGLPPGTYRLFVEPLDGPINLEEVSDAFQGGSKSFSTVFRSSTVAVGAGETSGINFQVGPLAMNAQEIAVLVGGRGLIGPPPLSARRGSQVEVRVVGTNLLGDITFSTPSSKLSLVTATSIIDQGLRRSVQIAADAPLGFADVYVASAALTAGLQITVNPTIGQGGVVEGASFNRTAGLNQFAAGSIISIFGTDLAERTDFATTLPLPTQLGGVSVQVGGRQAPLYYVSPLQINAMVPFEVSGTVSVNVLAGISSTSNSASIFLGDSAPRIFTTNQQGTGQGAILIANSDVVAAPSGSIQGRQARPAQRGEFISIFCLGLGAVSNRPPSGVAASGNPLSTTSSQATVTIGGVPAQVSFSGLAPGFVGLYQVNVQVPAQAVPGNEVPVAITLGSSTSNVATIAVEQ